MKVRSERPPGLCWCFHEDAQHVDLTQYVDGAYGPWCLACPGTLTDPRHRLRPIESLQPILTDGELLRQQRLWGRKA